MRRFGEGAAIGVPVEEAGFDCQGLQEMFALNEAAALAQLRQRQAADDLRGEQASEDGERFRQRGRDGGAVQPLGDPQ